MLKLNLHITDESADKKCLSVPTTLDEVDINYLKAVTSHIKLSDYYALVACLIRGSVNDRFNESAKEKDKQMGAAFVLVAVNDPDKKCVANIGDCIICSPQDIMLGYEAVSKNNVLSQVNIYKEIRKADDINKNKAFKSNKYIGSLNPISNVPFYSVGFKVVPLTSIKGSYDKSIEPNKVDNKYYE